MGKKTKGGGNLGRQLIKDRFGHTPRRKVDNDTMVRNTQSYTYVYVFRNLIFYTHPYYSYTQLSCRTDTTGVA